MHFIIFVIFIYLAVRSFSKNKEPLKSPISPMGKDDFGNGEEVKVLRRNQNLKGLMIEVDVDGIFILYCQVQSDGSPWIIVGTSLEDSSYMYNVRTYKWKDDDCPDHNYQKKIGKVLREEWQKALSKMGFKEAEKPKRTISLPKKITTIKRDLPLGYNEETLRGLPGRYEFQSPTSGEVYIVNLQKLECTCPDFLKRRKQFPPTDIRRLCKHQAKLIVQLGKNMKVTDNRIIQNIVRQASSYYEGVVLYSSFIEVKLLEGDEDFDTLYIMIPVHGSPWVEVVFFTDKSYYTHGYNIVEKRWARHQNPFPAGKRREYNQAIQEVLGIAL